MLESLLATISTSFADITMQVELSSPERQLLRKAKGKKKKSGWTPQEEHRGHIFVVHNVNSHTEEISVHLRGLTWTTEKGNCFKSPFSVCQSLRRAKHLVCSVSCRPSAYLTWAQTYIWLGQPWLLSNTRCKQSKANQLNFISRARCSWSSQNLLSKLQRENPNKIHLHEFWC